MIYLTSCDDMELVRAIVSHPDIWERFSDGAEPDEFSPFSDDKNHWLIVQNDTEVIGIIFLQVETSCAIGLHPYLIKKKRHLCHEMIQSFFHWFTSNVNENYVKINASIPSCYGSAINFARKCGFKDEGVSRMSYRLNDTVYDRVALGITRQEVIECLV